MNDLSKVSSIRIYLLLKNFAVAMLVIVVALTGSKYLPEYLGPVLSILCAAYLYYRIMHDRVEHHENCSIVNYTVFLGLLAFTFIIVVINVVFSFNVKIEMKELIFLEPPFIPSLLLIPILFITSMILYLRRKRLRICLNCHIVNGDTLERGRTGMIISRESTFQMRNMMLLFGVLSAVLWVYYECFYINLNVNARDWYVFIWLVVTGILLDLVYCASHYYNVMKALEDQGELISFEELMQIPKQTYLRYYLICGDHIFLQSGLESKYDTYKDHVDTPFTGSLGIEKVPEFEAEQFIRSKTGLLEGELRLFYSRKYDGIDGVSMSRYFYFLDGEPSDYKEMADALDGDWYPFSTVKEMYTKKPRAFKRVFLADLNRLATIMITRKMFDENGNRRFKIKSYQPSFTLKEVREMDVDFQSEKWMKIAVYNSDIISYRLNKWVKLKGKKNNTINAWPLMF